VNGKEHRVATVRDEDGKELARLYFLQGELKRVDILQENADTIVLNVTSLQNTADASYFSTKGLLPIDLNALSGLGGAGGGLSIPNLW
jgi:hypothetical protein